MGFGWALVVWETSVGLPSGKAGAEHGWPGKWDLPSFSFEEKNNEIKINQKQEGM